MQLNIIIIKIITIIQYNKKNCFRTICNHNELQSVMVSFCYLVDHLVWQKFDELSCYKLRYFIS